MNAAAWLEILQRVQSGALSVEAGLERLSGVGVADLGFARLDLDRAERQGVPEVVYGESKSQEQLLAILDALSEAAQNVLVTRVDAAKAAWLSERRPALRYDATARVLTLERTPPRRRRMAPVAILSAGTADLPVAEEAHATLEVLGIPALRVYDVGVAGIHRLFSQLPAVREAAAVIVVAGMEGALPSVVAGLVRAPVIAVPTSVGYGAALAGMTALFGMLTSCAAGLVVVNIDNGFGAAMAVQRMFADAEVE